MPAPLLVTFAAGASGQWRIDRLNPMLGEGLPSAKRLAILEAPGSGPIQANAVWLLRGATSNIRYSIAQERDRLAAVQQGLGRPASNRAALVPIRKSDSWWELAQDERRTIFEDQSRHIGTGLRYLPAVARRLYHCRDLGEPFDFLTWFEYAPGDAAAFEELVGELRRTEEWRYVEREVDIRLSKDGS